MKENAFIVSSRVWEVQFNLRKIQLIGCMSFFFTVWGTSANLLLQARRPKLLCRPVEEWILRINSLLKVFPFFFLLLLYPLFCEITSDSAAVLISIYAFSKLVVAHWASRILERNNLFPLKVDSDCSSPAVIHLPFCVPVLQGLPPYVCKLCFPPLRCLFKRNNVMASNFLAVEAVHFQVVLSLMQNIITVLTIIIQIVAWDWNHILACRDHVLCWSKVN